MFMNTIGEYFLKFIKLFKSVRLSAVVIALLILIYFLGLVLPQKWMFLSEEHYMQWKDKNILNALFDLIGFTDIYLSPVTIFLLVLFFVNLVVVVIYRVPVILRRAHLLGESPSFSVNDLKNGNPAVITQDMDSVEISTGIKAFFKKRRWSIIEGSEKNIFLAIKNRLSPIGFLLFHLSFLLCLIGGLLITYTRFSGEIALTEGQGFSGDIKQFHKIIDDAKIMKKLPPLSMYIDKVEPRYENDVPTELIVNLKINYQDEMRDEVIRVNEPLHMGPLSIIAQSLRV
jgi:cytochrome c biogenesis protein ResB